MFNNNPNNMQKLTLIIEKFDSKFISELISSGVTFEAETSSCGKYIIIIFTGGF